ncbi:MAG: hypothetical protein HFH82_15240 [Lachnospiraceae bacterium]|nr:hypothetical protein [Lachnospiraceae bacterium]
MDDNEIKNRIIDYIASENNIYLMCEKVFDLLEKQCNPAVLEFFFQEVDASMRSERTFTEEEKEQLTNGLMRYGKVWDEIMDALLNERLECEDFYAKLWNSIINTPLFETRDVKICILYLTCQNMCIPYYRLQCDLWMEEGKYRECVSELEDDIVKARSLIFQPCRQYTERAAALLELLGRWEKTEEKTVLFAQMIKLFEAKTRMKNQL